MIIENKDLCECGGELISSMVGDEWVSKCPDCGKLSE